MIGNGLTGTTRSRRRGRRWRRRDRDVNSGHRLIAVHAHARNSVCRDVDAISLPLLKVAVAARANGRCQGNRRELFIGSCELSSSVA